MGRGWGKLGRTISQPRIVIRETVVQTEFEIPPRPKPRDRYFVRSTRQENQPGAWPGSIVEVFRRAIDGGQPEKVCEY